MLDIDILRSNKDTILAICLILIIGVFYITTIRKGHGWGGDFSMYIHHAKNIVEGVDYKDTGYIYNPNLGAPKTYPPMFPLLLSPIYKCFGLNLKIMKIEIILIFLISLFLIFLNFKNEMPLHYILVIIALIGFNFNFWRFKDNIVSEFPFLFFLYLSFFLINKAYQFNKYRGNSISNEILIGTTIYFSYATRSIGIILIASLLIYDLVRFRKPSRFAIKVIVIFFIFMILQNYFFHSGSFYFNAIFNKTNVKTILYDIYRCVRSFSNFWDRSLSVFGGNGYNAVFRYAIFIIISGLAIIGYLSRIKDRITIFEIFFLLYIISIIIFPFQNTRFLIPIIPLYLFYAFVGIKNIGFWRGKELERFTFIVLSVLIFISYIARYTEVNFGPILDGIAKKESIDLFNYIKKKTDESDVFIFSKPRVLSLFTGRNASFYPQPKDDEALFNYFHKINVTHIIVGHVFPNDQNYLCLFMERHKGNFNEVYTNQDFKVYIIKNVLRL